MSSMNWEQWNQQLFEMIGRCRSREGSRGVSSPTSKAAAIGKQCQMIVSNNPDRNKSKAASVASINKAKVIADFISKGY